MSKSLDYFIGNPDYASSPRELLTEFLRERKIRPETFARDMEISETDLSRLLSDDSPWSDDTIQKIERATGVQRHCG